MSDEKKPKDSDMKYVDNLKQRIMEDYDRLGENDTFTFSCYHGMKCFTACCGDVNIFLTPYDVVRMKKRLGLSSQDFLEKYTMNPFTKTQKLPSVLMKLRDEDKRCHFVTEEGCTIYEDRPWACRMYPLGRASAADDGVSESEEDFYFLMAEDECLGVKEGETEFSVKGWIENQGIADYNEMGDLFKKVCLHPLLNEIDLTPQKMEMFYMACYNLDMFRRFVTQSRFSAVYDVSEEEVQKMAEDDEELHKFAMKWLLFGLYNEPTIKIREEVLAQKKKAMDLKDEDLKKSK